MSLGSSFQIGRSALAAYQAAISVTGQNIANLANPNYTRQSGRLTAVVGGLRVGGVQPGGGVRLTQLERHIDEALEGRLRGALGSRSHAEVVYTALNQTEILYNELTDDDLSTQLSQFFAQFANLETSPQDSGSRGMILADADRVIRSIQRLRSGLAEQVTNLNESAQATAVHARELTEEIAALNERVVLQEADGRTIASSLRDRRDTVVRELGELMDINVREQENGSINVYVGSEPLVEFDRSRGPIVETVLEDGLELASIRFADNHGNVILSDGKLFGLLEARDAYLRDQFERLDTLTQGLVYEVNRIHSTGVGLVGYESLLSNYAVEDPDAALNGDVANLPFPLENGTFIVNVRDPASGQVITRQIEVDLDGLGNNDTSLTSLAADLNNVPGVNATVTLDNRLQLTAASGQELWFSEDSSGALAALGVASFFEGQNANDIAVSAALRDDQRLIAASLTGETNDGDNAGRFASLAASTSRSTLLRNLSIQDYHESIIVDLAVETAAAATDHEAATAIYEGLYAQREAISGVSIDEEAIDLTKSEQAYQAATRFLSVVDELTTEMMGLL